jgi:DNA-binding CsgD family transcriptional regulator
MGAVEHLKTLCCLGLKPESAMIAVTPLLHEIIPHGWSRMGLYESHDSMGNGYSENPEWALYRQRFWRFLNDRSGIIGSLYLPPFRATAIGWSLHLQGRGWLGSDWYREIEAPVDSCWLLDAMIGDGGRGFAGVHLTRPRSARPFTVDDVQRLDRLRPWLAHAFRRSNSDNARQEDEAPLSTAGAPVRSGQMILTADAKLVCQSASLESLLGILMGEPLYCTRYVPVSDSLPTPVLKLIRQITGSTNGTCNAPPRMRISSSYGVLTLEAKWLVPAGTLPAVAARDPKSCLISVTIDLHEHAIAHAARVLRVSGATPAQTKVGIQLALGKPKPVIADKLGIQLSSVADHSKKLYQTLDVHNSTELGMKIWLDQKQDEARQSLRRAG